MAAVKPMLGDIELELVQRIEMDDDQVLAQHSVPALEGDFLQGLGRRAGRVFLAGVMTGPKAGESLKSLREKFRAAEPTSFVADIATATRVDEVLIEEMRVREMAGKPERFEYELALREFIPPPKPVVEDPPPPPPTPPIEIDKGTLAIEVTVTGAENFDHSSITMMVEGTTDQGASVSRTITERSVDTWTASDLLPGQYRAKASATISQTETTALAAPSETAPADIQLTASSEVKQVLPGQTARVSLTMSAGAIIAKTFLIHFRFDKAFVEPCMRPVLKQVADFARSNPGEKLVILGHTDRTGDGKYNQSLSERRARAVHAFLTFGRDPSAAVAEWNAIRLERVGNPLPTLSDNWGVRQYQHILQDLDFYPGNINGKDDSLTKEAVRAYRCHKGLPPGTNVDDEVWTALIKDYLGQDLLAIEKSQFFPNCENDILKWLGGGEEDPVDRTGSAFRPSRRVEMMFVSTNRLPCEIPQPDTFKLPAETAANNQWCLGGGPSDNNHVCFVSPLLQPGTNKPQPCPTSPTGPWCREPAEPGTITVQGSIKREDGKPAAFQNFVLIAPNGEFLPGELANGEPKLGTTDKDGKFTFADKRVGLYTLEVRGDVLVRLAEEKDVAVKGNSVCKFLRTDSDSLDAVIINAPVLREIRLPAVAHLMTALHPLTHEIRTCPSVGGPPAPQATAHSTDEIKAAFAEANRIWQQGRVRFELVDIVRETYSFRTECEVDDAEFIILMQRDNYPDAVNVYFVGDLKGFGEAGGGVSIEKGAAEGVSGCTLGDRFQTTILGPPLDVPLDAKQINQVLAHEFGHYLNVPHTPETQDNRDRLMFPSTGTGANIKLIKTEVDLARKSRGATDDCVPLSLRVTGATRVGGTLSNHFIIVQDAAATVTIDADIPDRLVDPSKGTLVMTGGSPGATDRQRIVGAAGKGVVEVVATYTPTGGGNVVTERVLIRVVTFRLDVDGATRVGGANSNTFVATRDPAQPVTVSAVIDPAPFCVPDDLVIWEGGTAAVDPQRRTFSRAAEAQTTISATVAGIKQSVTISVITVKLSVQGAEKVDPASDNFVAAQDSADVAIVTANISPPLSPVPFDLVSWTGGTQAADPLQRIVSKATIGPVTIIAQVASAKPSVSVTITSFTLSVEGAVQVGGAASTTFVALVDPGKDVTVVANITPLPSPLPPNFVNWSGGAAVAGDPLRRTVSRGASGTTTVTATVTGTKKSVKINIITFSLSVQDATPLGAPGSNSFIAVADAAKVVTVTANISPPLTPVPADLVTWSGGTEVTGNPLQRTVARASGPPVTVSATVAGTTKSVTINVVTFNLTVEGATQVGGASSTVFLEVTDPTAVVTVVANISPLPSPVPANIVTWKGGTPLATDPLRLPVSRAKAAVTPVSATVGGTTLSVTIDVVTFTLDVPGVTRLGAAGSNEFIVLTNPTELVTIVANVAPLPATVPTGIVNWSGGDEVTGNQFRRTVPRVSAAPVEVSAKVGSQTLKVTIHVVDFTLDVQDATKVGDASSTTFVALKESGKNVTIKANIKPLPATPLPANFVKWAGGTEVSGDQLQRTVSRDNTGKTQVDATVLGTKKSVTINIITFSLSVQGAVQVGDRSSKIFAAVVAAGQNVTIIGNVTPALSPVPTNLVTWVGGTSTADPLRQTVSRGAAAENTIVASIAGTNFQIEIHVLADPSAAGPFSVGEFEYTEATAPAPGTFTVPDPNSSIAGATITVRRRAIVRYPADVAGPDVDVSSKQAKYPLILILHGNHRPRKGSAASDPFVESYRGHEYIARHLASQGYIALSIDVDDINGRPGLIEGRGRAIIKHIEFMGTLNTTHPRLTGKIDLDLIGLIGHSRGGEGVVSAEQLNSSGGLGHKIKGIVSIAPTNTENFNHATTPYLVIYGSSDGDVHGSADGVNPFLLYDRASAPKAMVFIYGAIHNLFSTNADWLDPLFIDNDDARTISGADHQNIAKGYCFAFFERHFRTKIAFDIFFNHYDLIPSVSGVELHHLFRETATSVVDSFQDAAPNLADPLLKQLADRAKTNALNQSVSVSGLSVPTSVGAGAFVSAQTETLLDRVFITSFVHEGGGALIAWNSTAGRYTSNLGTLDVSAFQVLSFRVAQRLGSARNTANTAQDFFVSLTDTANQSAAIRVGTVTSIPAPFIRHDHDVVHPPPAVKVRHVDRRPDSPSLSKSALKTIRLRLDDFVAVNTKLKLNSLKSITFEFRQTSKGEIAIDDIEFSL